jgi:hypothetical protein
MNFETKHSVSKNVFGATVSFAGYGTDTMDEAHEKALFEDLGAPSINLGSIVFEGYFKVDGDKRVVEATEADGDKVSFIVNAKKLELGEGFVTSYFADAADVAKSELGESLTTGRLVAEAKALLFQIKVLDAVKTAVEAVKSESTRFENEVVPTLTV